jgi:UDP-N-acetyl-D-galactosamine dehydrogenase
VNGYCNKQFAKDELGIDVVEKIPNKKYDVVVLAVPHENYLNVNYNDFLNKNGFVYDVKSVLPKGDDIIRL